ncbi:hypothetical protein VCUG_01201 [Vavraia culicis subsp. floridensis]|uniref:Uncharacterized protein n=1 Tax=Vavraia culicis (isolate floridensis) TaxID=948595 RepID=L2GVD5_VAVCU|nr:uncharacterized protein VCUG_01201 [Vavraia culicis subsp. floridensis]ELA47317.1 hypothetical protein VCUG_01201 [Vavraia culicis subsp. floridensis]
MSVPLLHHRCTIKRVSHSITTLCATMNHKLTGTRNCSTHLSSAVLSLITLFVIELRSKRFLSHGFVPSVPAQMIAVRMLNFRFVTGTLLQNGALITNSNIKHVF